jgi:hypothetical protein
MRKLKYDGSLVSICLSSIWLRKNLLDGSPASVRRFNLGTSAWQPTDMPWVALEAPIFL